MPESLFPPRALFCCVTVLAWALLAAAADQAFAADNDSHAPFRFDGRQTECARCLGAPRERLPAERLPAAPQGRLALGPGQGHGDGAPPPAGRHVRLLAVGNSFSGNATRFLGDLVAASPGHNRLTFGHACIGGCPLEKHVQLAEAFEKNPGDPLGRPYAGKSSLREMLQREKWDYVTIQQASIKSFDVTTYRPWAGKLRDYIKRFAPQAEVLIHQTWAYRDDDSLFRGGKFSADEMHRELSRAYAAIAAELGCRRIPVGDAFQQVRQDPAWRFDAKRPVDPKAYRYPRLPEQGRTLHAGWRWIARNGRQVLANDTHHAGLAGEYLAACVWFEFLYRQSVVGNTFVPRGLPAHDARFLQEVAHQVVARAARSGTARV